MLDILSRHFSTENCKVKPDWVRAFYSESGNTYTIFQKSSIMPTLDVGVMVSHNWGSLDLLDDWVTWKKDSHMYYSITFLSIFWTRIYRVHLQIDVYINFCNPYIKFTKDVQNLECKKIWKIKICNCTQNFRKIPNNFHFL